MPTRAEVSAYRSKAKRKPRARRKPEELWPSIGGDVCAWIETFCVHGPGDVRGQSATLTDEERRFIWRGYEVDPETGRRRWARATYVRRKGARKTELAAWLSQAELVGPVRCDGFGADGRPIARRVTSPYIPVAATSLEQSEDTLWGAFYAGVTEGPLIDEFALDVGVDRVIELDTGGEAKPVTSSSIARDGGKPTFSPRDETHLWYSAELLRLNETLLRNLRKRPIAQPWALSTTTTWAPGQGSVAEQEARESAAEAAGALPPGTILWDLRTGALDVALGRDSKGRPEWRFDAGFDFDDDDQLRAAIIRATGDALPWTDVDGTLADFRRGHSSEGQRYWLSIPAAPVEDDSWLKDHPKAFEDCRREGIAALDPQGAHVAIGVDSALRSDSVAVWALQEQPDGTVSGICRTWVSDGGLYDRAELRNHLRSLVSAYEVKAIGYDPAFMETDAQILADEDLPMVEVPQSAQRMVPACKAAFELIVSGALSHDVDDVATSQVCAAVAREADGGWRLSKGKSRHKIDAAVALAVAEYVRQFVAAPAAAPEAAFIVV